MVALRAESTESFGRVTPRLTSRMEIRLSPMEPNLVVKVVSRTGLLCRNAGESMRLTPRR